MTMFFGYTFEKEEKISENNETQRNTGMTMNLLTTTTAMLTTRVCVVKAKIDVN